jgi:hypothetical protein
MCEVRSLGNYARNGLFGDVLDWIGLAERMWPADLGSFRVYRANQPPAYRGAITRRDYDSLRGIASMALELPLQTRQAGGQNVSYRRGVRRGSLGQGECVVNKLKQLEACGQSPWLDYLKRSLIEKGELRVLIERDGLKGVTSNPSIFEKAIGETDEYADALKQFQAQADHGISAIYEHLAIADIRAAADVLYPVYEQTHGRDGYISLECSPYLASDTEATVSEAQRLWAAVDRPNLMVKVPATPAGIPAIRQLIGRGLNINELCRNLGDEAIRRRGLTTLQ